MLSRHAPGTFFPMWDPEVDPAGLAEPQPYPAEEKMRRLKQVPPETLLGRVWATLRLRMSPARYGQDTVIWVRG